MVFRYVSELITVGSRGKHWRLIMSKLNTRALSDCPTFWVSKIEIFFNYRRIARVLKTRVAGGRGEGGVKGHAPPESIEILILWNGIFSVLRGKLLSEMFDKTIVIFMPIYVCVSSSTSARSRSPCFVFFFLDISFKYTLFLCKYHKNSYDMKYRNRCQNPDFFLSRSHFGRDSGLGISSKIAEIPTRSG